MPRSSGQSATPSRAMAFDGSRMVSVPANRIEPSRRATMPMIDFRGVVFPVPAKERHHLAFAHLEVDAVQDMRLAVPGVEAAHFEQVRHVPLRDTLQLRAGPWTRCCSRLRPISRPAAAP